VLRDSRECGGRIWERGSDAFYIEKRIRVKSFVVGRWGSIRMMWITCLVVGSEGEVTVEQWRFCVIFLPV